MAKVNMATANGRKRNKHNNDAVVLTTSEVGTLQPLHVINCHAGDFIDVNFSQVSQTSPTAVKTFGSFDLKTFAFFVPLKTVWRHYEDYRVTNPDASINCGEAPTLFCSTILNTLIGLEWSSSHSRYEIGQTDYATPISVANGSLTHAEFEAQFAHRADFVVRIDASASTSSELHGYVGAKLTAKGRMLVKILQGLGYEFPKCLDLVNSNETSAVHPMFSMSYDATPILAFARCFYDFIYPSAYVQQQGFGSFFEQDEWDFGDTVPNTGMTYFDKLCQLMFVPMSQDFFNSLWLRPNQKALGTSASSYNQTNITAPGGQQQTSDRLNILSTDNATSIRQQSSSTTVSMSAYALRWLQDMSDYVIRNNIGGTRFHEWMLSHFGWVSTEQDSNRSVFLKSFHDSLNFYPVQSTNETDTLMLGQMAANGRSQGNARLKFECKQDGFIIFVHLVVPQTAYYQGVKPWCRHLVEKEQYYIPELDSVGTEAIPRYELFYSYERMTDIDKAPFSQQADAFGFAFRYADRYKRQTSTLNGDFRLPSRNLQLDAYHTFRDVLYNRTNLALDAQFMHADNQYNRIYAVPVTEDNVSYRDHIESFFIFNVTRHNTMSSIGDSLPLFNKSGQDVTLENGGTQLN